MEFEENNSVRARANPFLHINIKKVLRNNEILKVNENNSFTGVPLI